MVVSCKPLLKQSRNRVSMFGSPHRPEARIPAIYSSRYFRVAVVVAMLPIAGLTTPIAVGLYWASYKIEKNTCTGLTPMASTMDKDACLLTPHGLPKLLGLPRPLVILVSGPISIKQKTAPNKNFHIRLLRKGGLNASQPVFFSVAKPMYG